MVTSTIDIKNDSIVTELNEKSILETKEAIKQGAAPLIRELVNTQGKLDEISSSIKQANDDSSLNMQKSSQAISEKINELSKSITNSSRFIEKSLAESYNKKIQPTAKSSG